MNHDLFSPVENKQPVPVGQIVAGSVLVGIGAVWLLSALDIADIPWRALLAGVLIVIGVALAAASSRDTALGGLITTGVTLVVVLALLSTASAAFSMPLRGGIGDRSFHPTAATLEAEYHLIAGQLDLGLDGVEFPEGETRIEVTVTFGKLVVSNIPDDVAVAVEAAATAGEIVLFGSSWNGVNINETITEAAFDQAARQLVIEASVGFGQIEVTR